MENDYGEGKMIKKRTKKKLETIKEILKLNKAFLTNEFKVKEIGLFGSLVRGEEWGSSDVDILVEFYNPIGFFKSTIGKYILEEVIFV